MNQGEDLSSILSYTAAHLPQKTFLRFEGRRFTYKDLDEMATSVAMNLKKEGLNKGESVSILSHNSPEYIAAYFGVVRAGGVVIPLNNLLNKEEIHYILNDSKTIICLYDSDFIKSIETIPNQIKNIKFIPLTEITKKKDSLEINHINPDDVSVILYTSGTTGHPKGAMLTNKNILSDAILAIPVLKLSRKDRFIIFLPLFHSFTFTVCVVIPIILGASITLLPSVKPFSRVIKRVLIDRITIFVGIPSIYNILSKKKIPFIFKLLLRVRLCISGAAPLFVDTIRDFERTFGVPLLEGYGLTEASPVISVNPYEDNRRKAGTVGLPLPGIEIKVVDDEGNELPHSTPGELIAKGPNIMKGYFNQTEETKKTIRNGWLYTGDIAIIDSEGYIKIVDRKKDMIIVDGLNIYPGEVEQVLRSYPAVEDCAMVGISYGTKKELPVMFVVKREGFDITEKEIRSFLYKSIATYKVPRKIIFIRDLPKNPTGKVLKKDLKQWRQNGER